MSRNIVLVLMYHRHKPLDHINFCCLKVTSFRSLGTVTGRTQRGCYDMHTLLIFFFSSCPKGATRHCSFVRLSTQNIFRLFVPFQ
jgi:hypothetical protein